MKSTRLPILCAGLLLVAAATGQAGCSDSDTTTSATTSTTGTMSTTSTTMTVTVTTSTTGGNGGTGGTGGQGGGGVMNTGDDTCSGYPVTLMLDQGISLHGDTSLANDDYASFCENDGSGPEVVYEIVVPADGTLIVSGTPIGDSDISLYMRKVCDDAGTMVWCRNGAESGLARSFTTAIAPGTYHLFVDSNNSVGGEFELNLFLATPSCPDNAVNPGEDCDDGNQDSGDGCFGCMFEAASLDDCTAAALPANSVSLPVGTTTESGTTLGNSNSHSYAASANCSVNFDAGVDRVHTFVPVVDGNMNIRVGWPANNMDPAYCQINGGVIGCWDRVVSVRTMAGAADAAACSNVNNQIDCVTTEADAYTNELNVPVTAGETYFVFIDSYWDGGPNPGYAAGFYDLNVTLTP